MVDLWELPGGVCPMDITGYRPEISSVSGLFILPANWRANEGIDSRYCLLPSAAIVSKASDDLPDPEIPVTAISLL